MNSDPSFEAPLRLAAARLLDAGRISDVRILQRGRIVTGMANPDPETSDRQRAYRVYIRYRPAAVAAGGSSLEGECSCGGSTPCAHVAAVALFAARQAASSDAAPRHAGPPYAGAAAPDPQRAPREAAPSRSTRQRLCYALESTDDGCCVSLWVAQESADGHEIPDGVHRFAARPRSDVVEHPRYVDDQDRLILGMLPRQSLDRCLLQGAAGFALLQRMVATGRAVWQHPRATPLRSGATRELAVEWRAAANGEQQLRATAAVSLHVLVGLEPAAYIDLAGNECGALRLPCDLHLLRRYWHRPLVPEAVPAVLAQLAGDGRAEGLPLPHAFALRPQPLATLRGNLTLSAGPRITVNFLYNDLLIADGQPRARDATVRRLDGVVHEIPRDRDRERALRAELEAVLREPPQTRDAWLRLLVTGVPALRTLGWTITIDEDFPYRVAPMSDWYAELAANRRADWFDLQLGVLVDGRPVNLLPALMEYLQATSATPLAAGGTTAAAGQTAALPSLLDVEHWFVPLEDGRYLPVPTPRLRRIAETLVELFDRDALNGGSSLTLPQHQAGRLALLAQDEAGGVPVLRSDDASLLTRVAAIRGFAGIVPLPAPAECRATLRGYQAEGLGWLQFLRLHRLGGILADDMGLGKLCAGEYASRIFG